MPLSFRSLLPVIILLVTSPSWCIQLKVSITENPPVIDGTVSASEQTSGSNIELTRVGGLDKPIYPTKVFVSATLKGLYIGFIAKETHMDTLVTSVTQENGPVFNDDSVQILLTPTMDTAADAYYHFAVNPNGVRYSNHLSTGDVVSGWKSAVSKTADGWEAEFFIPLTSIDAPAELPTWRANFARERPARASEAEETSAWVNPGISLHNYKRFGFISMPRFVPAAPTTPEFTTNTVEVYTTATEQQ